MAQDAFYPAVEQRDNPAYRNKPVVVGGAPNSRGVVSMCSYEAKKFGIHSAMHSSRAYQLCPDAIFVPPRFDVYREASYIIRIIFAEYTSLVETLSAWIGCQRFIYNSKVGEDRYFRKFQRNALSLTGQHPTIDQQYSHFKDDELTPWLSEVPSQVLRNGAVLWNQAYSRFFAKLAGRPVIQKRHGRQSVWLTSELFQFGLVTDKNGAVVGHSLYVGTKTVPVGCLEFKSHRFFTTLPNSIHISVHEGRWYVSFSCDDELPEPTLEEIAYELSQFTEAELLEKTVGLDRNVALNVTTSER